ncbi:hypothetical protein LPB140_09235 [Sphingorhabdus lutea]|uniref:Uncharacterized protein n=1 Tax=Sphingorhabdus lutea TaxID=1913578 RepID=A0A1L3JCS6_9SPHN|nr:hypothetical protein [Sphingorhabdus lutea]APG62941.1 hypothetical protein LPB140_09235 [Sphingorhabdus lutea]
MIYISSFAYFFGFSMAVFAIFASIKSAMPQILDIISDHIDMQDAAQDMRDHAPRIVIRPYRTNYQAPLNIMNDLPKMRAQPTRIKSRHVMMKQRQRSAKLAA